MFTLLASMLLALSATASETIELPDHQTLNVHGYKDGWVTLTDDVSTLTILQRWKGPCRRQPKASTLELTLADGQRLWGAPKKWQADHLVLHIRCGVVRVPEWSLDTRSVAVLHHYYDGKSTPPDVSLKEQYNVSRGAKKQPRRGSVAATAIGVSALMLTGFSVGAVAVYSEGFTTR